MLKETQLKEISDLLDELKDAKGSKKLDIAKQIEAITEQAAK